jgi:tungstate transport system substrate-binding protein
MKQKGKLVRLLVSLVMLVSVISLLTGCTSTVNPTAPPAVTFGIGSSYSAPANTSAPAETTTAPAPTTTTATPKPTISPFANFTTAPAVPEIIMASTTSTRDSGLMDVLIPIFEKETGYKIKPVYVGTGAAIQMGQEGNADVVLVHSPSQEQAFVNSGAGVYRQLLMHNDFIIVGPASDPAGIKGMTSATEAFKKISTAQASFYSRGDKSGTDTAEKAIWKKIGITVADGSSKNPAWYHEGGTGTGMLALLKIAMEKDAYTLTDRSTYLANKATVKLDIMVEGDPSLLNVYHIIAVNPNIFPKVNFTGARIFMAFMMSDEAQNIIATFGQDKYGQALFFADAHTTEQELGTY